MKSIFFENKHTIAEKITQTTDDCKTFCQIDTIPFKESINVTLCVTETYTLLQKKDGYN